MSVIKNKRSLSELEFFHNAIRLRKEMTGLLLRDFGVKARNKDTQVFPKLYKMDKDDGKVFLELCEKYKIVSTLETYPEWLIREFRESILMNLRELIKNITCANSIYPACLAELTERRICQDRAIGNCETLLQEMAYAMSVLPNDANKYMHYVDMIQREIALLKGWRKSDNKLKSKLKE